MKTSDKLGQFFVQEMRDEHFKSFKQQVDWARTMTLEEYHAIDKNPDMDPGLQKTEDHRMELYISLNEEQLHQVEKLVLSTIDNNNFAFLRAAEEAKIENKGLGLQFDGVSSDDFSDELLSGTLFGEYFDWVERFSEFGSFEY